MAFPQVSLGPPSSSCKVPWDGTSPEGPLRSHRAEWLGLRLRFLPHRPCSCSSKTWEAHESLCWLTAALNNFVLHPGEAGVAAAKELGALGEQGRCRVLWNTPLFVPLLANRDIPLSSQFHAPSCEECVTIGAP